MTILTVRKAWHAPRPSNETRRSSDLTPEEQAAVRRALVFLRARHGSWGKLAVALRANEQTVKRAGARGRSVSAGVALRAARVAGVAVDELLTGRWPAEGACPWCGRSG